MLLISGVIFQLINAFSLKTSQMAHKPDPLHDQSEQWRAEMIYGRMAALITMGFLSDCVVKGRNYLLLFLLASLACIIHLVQIFFLAIDYEIPYNDAIQHVTYGYYTACLNTLMSILIPLFLAAKKRDEDSVWDVPIAAMVLSVSQVFITIFPIMLSDGCQSLFDLDDISKIL